MGLFHGQNNKKIRTITISLSLIILLEVQLVGCSATRTVSFTSHAPFLENLFSIFVQYYYSQQQQQQHYTETQFIIRDN